MSRGIYFRDLVLFWIVVIIGVVCFTFGLVKVIQYDNRNELNRFQQACEDHGGTLRKGFYGTQWTCTLPSGHVETLD